MKDTYNYVIHAYEDVRWKRALNHQHGCTTVLNDGASALGRATAETYEEATGMLGCSRSRPS
jgi:hypothetical protein